MVEVHLVFNQLDDGQEQVGVAEPAEHIFEDGQVLVLHSLGDTVGERRQHHDRYLGILGLDVAGDVKHIIVVGAWHADDKIERSGCHHPFSFFLGGHLCETRG